MNLSTKLNTFLILFIIRFLNCNTFLDPYDENAKVFIEDGHITFESAHNKDINFKTNFGQIKLNGVQISDILKLVNNYKNDQQQFTSNRQPQSDQLMQSVNDLKDRLKNYEKLQDDVKELKEVLKQMLNDNKIKPEHVYKSVAGFNKMKKVFDKFKDLLNINECESNPCKNGASCLDLFGGYVCQCSDGWNGKNCDQDIDECALYASTTLGCQNNAQCINTPGAYHCVCKNGFQGTHCTTRVDSNNACNQASNKELCAHGQCVTNSANNSFSCICEPGWSKEFTSPACTVDIDECEEHKQLAELILRKKSTRSASLSKISMDAFYKKFCSIKPLVECFNTLGSFRCGPCPTGYSGNGQICFDVNECETNNGGCSTNPYVECINTDGSRVCGSCPENYSGDGVSCKPMFIGYRPIIYSSSEHNYDKPCQTNPCLNEAECFLRNSTNLEQSTGIVKPLNKNDFYCVCDVGFTGKYCETIMNFCIENGPNDTINMNGPCKNNGTCFSLIGGYNCICQLGWKGDTCEIAENSCGGDLRTDNGTLSFPYGDHQSLPNKNSYDCEWRIDAVIGKVIEINIKNLTLDLSYSCSEQYLKITDGIPGLTENRQVAKLCGNLNDLPKNSTKNITSVHSFVTINYHLDASDAEEGYEDSSSFELDWKTVNPKCGGLIKNITHGSINSPGYPNGYPHLSDCIWILQTKLNRRIQLYFAELSIEEDSVCINDYVEIFDGETDQSPSLGRFCNTTVPPPITSSGPFVRIHFLTDAFNTDKGFHLTYNTIPSVENCGGLFTNEKDHIMSPNFGIKYQNNLECLYQIRLKNLYDRIKITIKFLDIEEHKSCKFDYLEFYDGPDEYANKKGRYCLSKSTNTTIISSSNVMLIKFRTDKSFRGNGFILNYEKFCSYSFTETSGIIKSNGYPRLSSSENCAYEISVPEKNLIKIEFQDLNIELSPNCTTDSLSIFETLQKEKRYCGDTTPDPYISSFNNLVIILQIKYAHKHRGFRLSYSTIEVDCGGLLTKTPGFIASPTKSGQTTYKSNIKCNWILRAPTDQIIKLTFTTFAIEHSPVCKFDYVRVLDSQFNEIGKYCGNEHPSFIQSMDNELIVQFVSDKTNQLEGFSATYVFTNSTSICGGHLAQENSEIVSPGFYTQKRYAPNLNCVWYIRAPLNKQIRLNFTFLDIESNDCAYDKIELHNGPDVNSPLLAVVCGQLMPPLLVSHSNELTIVFITDSNKETKGFRLTYDTALTGCGGTLTTPTGSVSSPNWPKHYGANAICDYLIYVAKGSTVQLNFVEIDIERDDACQFDYVELYDGQTEFSPKIGRYCNLNTKPGIIKSTTNAILVRFRSDASYGKKGFLLNYITNCTNQLSGYRGVIESLNFPYSYFSTFDCKYLISVPRGNKINLVFTHLELEDDNKDCSKVSLTINELTEGEVNKNLTKKLCDSNAINQNLLNFNSTTNMVEILFKRNQSPNAPPKVSLRLEYYLIGCGGEFLYKPSGVIQTPDYPKAHSFELDCLWHIYTTPNNRIILSIIDFDIATGNKCEYGFVKILGGPTLDSPELSKICEKQSTLTKLTSSGSSMTILLKNGLGVSGKGLNAQFYVDRNKACGGVFTLNEGFITSKNYPAQFDATDDCFYAIESNELKQIEIKIEDLRLPGLKNCTGGQLTIFNGRTSSSPVLTKHCGENFEPYTVKSSSNKVLIRFKANGHATNGAFKLSYRMICGGSVILRNNQQFILSSPNYPFYSNVHHQCVWYFTCDYDQKMAITVTHLEPVISLVRFGDFIRSKLQFNSGTSLDSPVIKTVQKSIPSTFVTPGNSLAIISNRTVFRLSVSTITNSCGGQIKVSQEGEFSTPDFPNNYPMGINCEWTLTTGLSNRIKLEFLDFKLQESEFCNLDYIEIRDTSRNGKLIGRFCGHELPVIDNEFLHPIPKSIDEQSMKKIDETYSNSTKAYELGFNKLWIRFKSEKLGSDSGFRIKYSLLSTIFLINDSGQISNSQYPSVGITTEVVVWHITTPESTIVSLTVKKVQLTMLRDSYCLSHLNFYDGDLDSGTLIAELCGFELPEKPIESSSNQMTIVYMSNGMSLFLLEYKAINKQSSSDNNQNSDQVKTDCSEQIYLNDTNSITLTSPGYPNGYENLLCIWNIESPVGKKINIRIDDLDIEGVSNCYYDKLNVYDKNLDDEVYLNQTLCGRKKNVSLLTNSNFARIEFNTDAVGNGTGFKLSLSTVCGGYVIGKSKGVLSFNVGRKENSYAVSSNTAKMENFKCSWIISVSAKRKMSLKFRSILFGTQSSKDCSESFVLIRDGSTLNAPILGKYCNRTNENLEINETSSNQVYVTFFALRGLYQTFNLSYEEIRVGCTQKYNLQTKDEVITIQSPQYPEPPQGAIECDWTFLAPASTSIRVDFKIVNMNIPCNLSEQSISIYNGGSALSSLLIRDCPRMSSVFSTENMIHISYITNGENLHAAFQANVQIAICGGSYIIRHRVLLKSKNNPSNYFNNLNCKYYFQTELPSYNLEFKITKLDLANNTDQAAPANITDCEAAGDFLEIRDQDGQGPLLGKFCGSFKNKKLVHKVTSYSDHAYVLFKTDSEQTASGYLIEISMLQYKCGNLITDAKRGLIKSHNYDSEIKASVMKSMQRLCRWEIIAPLSNRVELKFKKINLKSDPTNHSACIDTLMFYSKPPSMDLKIKELNKDSQCNFVIDQKIVSLNNIMIIEFNTFGLDENEGFIIEYDGTKEALCGGKLQNLKKGTIEMSNEYLLNRNVTVNYGDSISCVWYISPNEFNKNYTFTLSIDQLDFPEPLDTSLANALKNLQVGDNLGRSLSKNLMRTIKNPCSNSSVMIGQILSTFNLNEYNHFNYELCGNLTGRNLFYVFAQTGIFVPFIFAHMIVEQRPKFMRINYSFNRCGNTYYNYGKFSSPNYGESNYDNDLICVYIVNVFSSQKLILEFTAFDLEQDDGCNNDYVEVLNGFLIDQSPSIGKFCGKIKPKPMITSGSSVSLIFRTNSAKTGKGFEFTVQKYESNQTCGDDFKMTNFVQRYISSPLYPNAYKNNLNCLWTFEVNSNYHMNIEFSSRFDIEQSTNCTNDLLLIEEKEANKWRYLNKLCGIKLPNSIKTQSNQIRITFKTNQNVTGDGFQLKVTRECGRVFDNDSPKDGYILSPGYPNYDSNLACAFVFNRTKNDFIVLKLEDFEIEDCPNDYLMIIKDKNSDSSPTTESSTLNNIVHLSQINSLVYGKKLGPFCGEIKPPNLITGNQYLKLTFTTDSFKSSKGFKFSYKIIECGQDFNDLDSGEIVSPNVDQSEDKTYIHNADCFWNIKVSTNYSIVLRFEYLNIEVCGRMCHCDYLEILELGQTSTPLAKLCGHDKFPLIKSTSNQIRLHFHSDYTGSSNGFRLVFSKVIGENMGCGKTIITDQVGYIESPDIDKDGLYEKNLDCIWTIQVDDQKVVKLTFENLNLEAPREVTNECIDYIQVNDGLSSSEPLIDIFCGNKKPDQVQSSSNRIFIYFKTDGLNEFKGFKLKYEPIQFSCGGQILIQNEEEYLRNSNSSFIYSPNYPASYPNNIRCKWTFTIPFYIRLELNIIDFNLNCSNNDFLQYSLDRKHENLIKLCTHSEYMNNRRLLAMSGLWLIFNSGQGSYESDVLFGNMNSNKLNKQIKNGNEPFKFKINFKILNCNQTYTTENGLIASSKYPAIWSSHSNEICKFTIETDIDRTISVYFSEFSIGKMQAKANCNENRMEIRNGKAENSRRLAVLCGFTIPNPVFSSGNVLSFYVKAVNTYNKYYMYYTTTDQGIGCGGNLTSFNGTFTSPLYPNYYYQHERKECVWRVHSLGQNKLQIRFDNLEFENAGDSCNFTYLEIYDGETISNETFLITLCPQDESAQSDATHTYTSFTSFIYFKLTVTSPNEGVKFKVNYNINTLKGFNNQIFTTQNKDNFLHNDGFSLVGN